jgi:hypothetical protein
MKCTQVCIRTLLLVTLTLAIFIGWVADRHRLQTHVDEANTQLNRAHQQLDRVARLAAERETEIAYRNRVAKKSAQ